LTEKGKIMATGNKGFAAGLAGSAPATQQGSRLPPRTGILSVRENRLAEMASGSAITRVQELVDPAKCRIWDGHNRDYQDLNEKNCADLIESFKAQGKQEVPAIVRRIAGQGPEIYEVICGARRHWSVSWMRSHNYPDFRFLVEPRELTDEEAFRIADLENRSRRDLSDYERAYDYARAIERYYDGSQQVMADRLEVTKSWLSRYLELAKLPDVILSSFGSPHVLGISHSAKLAPILRKDPAQLLILEEARKITEEQNARHANGQVFLPPAAVVQKLLSKFNSDVKRPKAVAHQEFVARSPDGHIIARGEKMARGGRMSIVIPTPARFDRRELLSAIDEVLDSLAPVDTTKERINNPME
jgi:ParB family chromosome partitioning protein